MRRKYSSRNKFIPWLTVQCMRTETYQSDDPTATVTASVSVAWSIQMSPATVSSGGYFVGYNTVGSITITGSLSPTPALMPDGSLLTTWYTTDYSISGGMASLYIGFSNGGSPVSAGYFNTIIYTSTNGDGATKNRIDADIPGGYIVGTARVWKWSGATNGTFLMSPGSYRMTSIT